MVYHSKPDVFSILSIFLLIWIMGVVSLVPFITSFAIGIIMFAIFVISAIFIWWYTVSIQYVFCEDDLLIKGGPFQNKIPYESIRRVAPTSDKLTGYRISAADKGLELFYQRDVHGSIKILLKDKMQFISELKKRCANVQLPPNQTFE